MVNDTAKLIETLRQAQDLRVHRLVVDRDGSFQVEFFPAAPVVVAPAAKATPEEERQRQVDDDLAAVEGGP